jgi:hypothetical protein
MRPCTPFHLAVTRVHDRIQCFFYDGGALAGTVITSPPCASTLKMCRAAAPSVALKSRVRCERAAAAHITALSEDPCNVSSSRASTTKGRQFNYLCVCSYFSGLGFWGYHTYNFIEDKTTNLSSTWF